MNTEYMKAKTDSFKYDHGKQNEEEQSQRPRLPAYAPTHSGHPNSHSNDETVLLQATAHANHTIYNDIIGQMDPDQTEYIQKMIQRASRHESKNAKSKPVLHERVKSHADIVRSPMASIHREHNESQLSVKRKVETEVPPNIKAAAK